MICMMDFEFDGYDCDYKPSEHCKYYQKKKEKKLTKKQLRFIKSMQKMFKNYDYLDPDWKFSTIVYKGKNKYRTNAFIGHSLQDAYDYCVLILRVSLETCYYEAQEIGGVSFNKEGAKKGLKYWCNKFRRVFKVEKAELLSEEFMGSEI